MIRKIQQTDNAQLANIIRDVFVEYGAPLQNTVYDDPRTDRLYEEFQADRSALFVIEEGGEVLGACGYYPTEGLPEGYAELVKFYFSPRLRGRGYGSRIFRKVLDEARADGYTHIYLESFPEFSFAVSIYEKNGFRHLPDRLGNSGHLATSIHMVREL